MLSGVGREILRFEPPTRWTPLRVKSQLRGCMEHSNDSLNQWCKKCGPRAKCGPRRHELWPAEGPKISIVMRPAKLRSAARGRSAGRTGDSVAAGGKFFDLHPPPPPPVKRMRCCGPPGFWEPKCGPRPKKSWHHCSKSSTIRHA